MLSVDIAVIGGGIQGLLILRELVAAGYSVVLVTKHPLGTGQTLHSHGLLNSGTGLLTGLLRDETATTINYLRALGVGLYGSDSSFLALPKEVVDTLAPMWRANAYEPRLEDPASLPAGFVTGADVYRAHGVNVDKRRLVEQLSSGMSSLIIQAEVMQAKRTLELRSSSGEALFLDPRAIVVSCGCGTKGVLSQRFGITDETVTAISYTKPHMICLRSRRENLPYIGSFVSPQLIIVGHPSDASGAVPGSAVTWYVTPAQPTPTIYDDAPDDALAEVESDAVKRGIEQLASLFPPLLDRPGIQASVFAGYKQDHDGQPTKSVCKLIDEQRNLLVVLPSVLANAVPNAVAVVRSVSERLGDAQHLPAELPDGTEPAVGDVPEAGPRTDWVDWHDFMTAYAVG